MNQDKADKYDANRATALYNIVICLSQLDIKIIKEKEEIKNK